jgi:hypothetical protein
VNWKSGLNLNIGHSLLLCLHLVLTADLVAATRTRWGRRSSCSGLGLIVAWMIRDDEVELVGDVRPGRLHAITGACFLVQKPTFSLVACAPTRSGDANPGRTSRRYRSLVYPAPWLTPVTTSVWSNLGAAVTGVLL